jgi:cytochrome c oxidase cbb3-type subunit 3
MSGHSHFSLLLIGLSAVVLGSCQRANSSKSNSATVEDVQFVQLCSVQAGGQSEDKNSLPTTESLNATRSKYEESQSAVDQGEQFFSKYNCTGCHGNGGGGSGVPLMDDKWIYGNRPDQIFNTIAEGRPNGMPCFGRKIPEDQIWRLVAFVRSLGGLTPGVQPGRKDPIFASD